LVIAPGTKHVFFAFDRKLIRIWDGTYWWEVRCDHPDCLAPKNAFIEKCTISGEAAVVTLALPTGRARGETSITHAEGRVSRIYLSKYARGWKIDIKKTLEGQLGYPLPLGK